MVYSWLWMFGIKKVNVQMGITNLDIGLPMKDLFILIHMGTLPTQTIFYGGKLPLDYVILKFNNQGSIVSKYLCKKY